MKLIDPSYEIVEQGNTLQDIYRQIELAGRTCYKSEDKITADSAESFVKRMIESKHTAMLEHGSVYLYFKHNDKGNIMPETDPYDIELNLLFNNYTKHNTNYDTHESFYTTNLRVLVEIDPEHWEDIIKYHGRIPDDRWPMRRSVKMTTSLHVYKDITRHRTMSFAIESTRFCNYNKGKFNSELTFIKPCWEMSRTMINALTEIEVDYLHLIDEGWQAQQAAEILPQCVKADVFITGFEDDWAHIFNLRAFGTTGKPHPEVKRIFEPLYKDFKQHGFLKSWTTDDTNNSNGILHRNIQKK